MTPWEQISHNVILVAPITAWFIAQVLKTIIYLVLNKQFVAERIVGGGGMPSAHSATVCALATTVAIKCGLASTQFAICAIFATVTMYDAMGVRRETGRQGEVLNDLIDIFKKMGTEVGPDKALKELIGHSPLQVIIGATLGVVVAIIMCNMNFFM